MQELGQVAKKDKNSMDLADKQVERAYNLMLIDSQELTAKYWEKPEKRRPQSVTWDDVKKNRIPEVWKCLYENPDYFLDARYGYDPTDLAHLDRDSYYSDDWMRVFDDEDEYTDVCVTARVTKQLTKSIQMLADYLLYPYFGESPTFLDHNMTGKFAEYKGGLDVTRSKRPPRDFYSPDRDYRPPTKDEINQSIKIIKIWNQIRGQDLDAKLACKVKAIGIDIWEDVQARRMRREALNINATRSPRHTDVGNRSYKLTGFRRRPFFDKWKHRAGYP